MPTQSDYVLGHSDRELERLRRQADLINPITEGFLREAGVGPGMHILDIGCGGGDVSILAAQLIGKSGSVLGVDRSATALGRARARVKSLGLDNVTFEEMELANLSLGRKFDAAIGRYVLCFQQNPAALLRLIASQVKPQGLVLFHEPDRQQMRSEPPVETYDNACQWVSEVYRQHGVDIRTGIKLYDIYTAAGLPSPVLRFHAVIGGATALDIIHLDADQAEVVAPEIIRLGLASAEELSIGNLVERIRSEMLAKNAVIIGRGEIGAWARV